MCIRDRMETLDQSLCGLKASTTLLKGNPNLDNRKAVKIDVTIVNQKAIYARVISLMVSQWDVDFGQVLSPELAAYPSMFHSDGSMRLAIGKASLKKMCWCRNVCSDMGRTFSYRG